MHGNTAHHSEAERPPPTSGPIIDADPAVFEAEWDHWKDISAIGAFLATAAARRGWEGYEEEVSRLNAVLTFPLVA